MLALVVGIALAGAFYSLYRERSGRRQALESPRRLAILPFQNLRQDPNSDFLGFSLADAVITKLDYVSSLTVRPSAAVEKYRDKAIDIQSVGESWALRRHSKGRDAVTPAPLAVALRCGARAGFALAVETLAVRSGCLQEQPQRVRADTSVSIR